MKTNNEIKTEKVEAGKVSNLLNCYASLVNNVKLLLNVVEAPAGKTDVIKKEREQYFKAKKAISKIIMDNRKPYFEGKGGRYGRNKGII